MPPLRKDLDLLEITNILFPEREYRPSYQLNSQNVGFENGYKPKILLVGTSFLFDIQKQLEKFAIAEQSPLYFYNRSVRKVSSDKLTVISRKKLKKSDLLQFDVIVLETNKSKVSTLGNGFIQQALAALESKVK